MSDPMLFTLRGRVFWPVIKPGGGSPQRSLNILAQRGIRPGYTAPSSPSPFDSGRR